LAPKGYYQAGLVGGPIEDPLEDEGDLDCEPMKAELTEQDGVQIGRHGRL
jgi:hypothetical protein